MQIDKSKYKHFIVCGEGYFGYDHISNEIHHYGTETLKHVIDANQAPHLKAWVCRPDPKLVQGKNAYTKGSVDND